MFITGFRYKLKLKILAMEWKKEIPNKEGLYLRQCAAKGHNNLHVLTKRIIHQDNKTHEVITMDWGWEGESTMISVNDPKMKHKLEAFYWYGPIELPPDSNLLIVTDWYF